MNILLVLGCIVCLFGYANADCGVCDPNTHFMCINRNSALLCKDGLPTETGITCPNGFVCISNSPYPCGNPQESNYDCQEKCSGVCPDPTPGGETALSFICIGSSSFKICNEGHTITLSCNEGEVCTASSMCAPRNASNVPVCDSDGLTTTSTTANPIITTTTTTQGALTPDEICNGKPSGSKYPLSPPDPFCRWYVSCRLRGGVVRGTLTTCPSSQQFNAATGACQKTAVIGCRSY